MDSAVSKASMFLKSSTKKPENIEKNTSVHPTDEGVAITLNIPFSLNE